MRAENERHIQEYNEKAEEAAAQRRASVRVSHHLRCLDADIPLLLA